MSGFEILQVVVFSEPLSGTCVAKRFDGLGIGNLYGKRDTSQFPEKGDSGHIKHRMNSAGIQHSADRVPTVPP